MAAALGGLTIAAVSAPGARGTETLYAADSTISSVSAFSIAADGGLSAVSGSPFPADSLTEFVTATPSGKYVYATNTMAGDVSAFSVGPTGALTPVVGSPFPAGTNRVREVPVSRWTWNSAFGVPASNVAPVVTGTAISF